MPRLRLISTICAKIVFTSSGAMPSEGSSSIRNFGLLISARPMASICCSPPDSVPACCFSRSFRRGKTLNT